MTPLELSALVLRVGLPAALQLAEMVTSKRETVTAEDIARLRELGSKTTADYLREAGVTPG